MALLASVEVHLRSKFLQGTEDLRLTERRNEFMWAGKT